jgi:hypothetical protein
MNYVTFFNYYVTKKKILGSYFRNYLNMYYSKNREVQKPIESTLFK